MDPRITKENYLDAGPVISMPDVALPYGGVPGFPGAAGDDPVLQGHEKDFIEFFGESDLHNKIRLVLEEMVGHSQYMYQ